MEINLKGYRTKIVGWIMAAIPALGMLGYEIDPVTVETFLHDAGAWIAGGYVLAGSAVHYFRNQAGK